MPSGLEQEVHVAGSPLTVLVDAQKRCLDQDRFRLESLFSWAAKRSSITATSSTLICCSRLNAARMRLTLGMLRIDKFRTPPKGSVNGTVKNDAKLRRLCD